jgi:hypothetical protein
MDAVVKGVLSYFLKNRQNARHIAIYMDHIYAFRYGTEIKELHWMARAVQVWREEKR